MCRKNTPEQAEAAKQRARDGARERMRVSRALHPEKERERKQRYAESHVEEVKARNLAWDHAHREVRRAASRARHHRNKEQANANRRLLYRQRNEAELIRARRAADPAGYRAAQRAYRAENRTKVAAWDRAKRAKRRAAEGHHTTTDILNRHAQQGGRCHWCKKLVGTDYHIDHVIPLAKGGTDWPTNIVIACPPCNMHKHDKLPEEWAQWLARRARTSHPTSEA